ncbi:MAG: fructosamine kinase family protein [Tepidisphaeraceae bacterium]
MSGTEDISWQELRRIVQEWKGTAAELDEVTPLPGGHVNTTLCLTTRDGHKSVLKISPHRVDRSYEREAHQLKLLQECGVPTPAVYVAKTGTLDHPFSYILIEFMNGVDLAEAKRTCSTEAFNRLQEQLAEIVSTMHDRTRASYCKAVDGQTQEFASWPAFYRDVYDAIWHEAEKSPHLPAKCRKQIGRVHERLERLIAHGDVPRLVHWDLWSSNLLVNRNGDGNWHVSALLDPNCKYAHAEAEIAYMELFHTVTPAFMRAYQRRHKLGGDYYQFRRPVYQLYPLINHLRLFGHDYVKPLTAAVERTTAIV